MAIPMAVPAMPDSANGESKQRSSPNCWLRPSVILNTPPSVATSSPKTTTMSLADISSARAALSAAARVRVDFSLLMLRLLRHSYRQCGHRGRVLLPAGRVVQPAVGFAPSTHDRIDLTVEYRAVVPWPHAVPMRRLLHRSDTEPPAVRLMHPRSV